MSSRKSSRSLKRVDYGGQDYEADEGPARPVKRARKATTKQDTDFSPASDDDEVPEPRSEGITVPHSRTLHDIENISPLLEPLLKWFDSKKSARGMPWRKEFDATLDKDGKAQRAYEVLVSEIMLQQTQVATVIPYFTRWMETFPTIRDLAAAGIEDVNRIWKGLGYYRRAKFLLKAAQKVVEDFDGRIPANVSVMEKDIPGAGRYTAGAVCSIVYGIQAPAVDGNVLRLFSRLLAVHAPLKGKAAQDVIWNAAGSLVKQTSRPGDLNQAFIELGSTVCTPHNPSCTTCPLQEGCAAFGLSLSKPDSVGDIEDACGICEPFPSHDRLVTRFPMKVSKKPPRKEASVVTVIQAETSSGYWYVMAQRPQDALLAGLWEFPTTDLKEEPTLSAQMEASRKMVNKFMPGRPKAAYNPIAVGNFLHLFSHIRKQYYVVCVPLKVEEPLPKDVQGVKWVKADDFEAVNTGKGSEKVWKLIQGMDDM